MQKTYSSVPIRKPFLGSLPAWLVVTLLPTAVGLRAAATPDYAAAIRQMAHAVKEEMTFWQISGIAVALVDDQQTVYSAGFGEAKRESVFRCGSISKLFNAVAVMQLVEAGKLDLDAPVERYAKGLLPVNPFTNSVTLRQLLCHRSGMIREAPVGGYFADAQPGLEATIDSISQCVLVNPPNTKTRYSNVGPSVAGRVVELTSGARFEAYQQGHILKPLGMTHSAWKLKQLISGKLVPSYMRVADGHGGFIHQRSPVFDLGTVPAGNLFTTAGDLARFVSMLAAEGQGANGRVLKPESLAQMFQPQLISEPAGFGLGFMVGKFRDHKTISHNGAVYGHSSALVYLPDAKVGVVVLGNEDIVNARIQKLANLGLSLMLETKLGEKPPAGPPPVILSPGELAELCGDFESQSFWAQVRIRNGNITADISGQVTRLSAVGPLRFLADSPGYDAAPMVFERNAAGLINGFTLASQKFTRLTPGPWEIPREWRAYLGSYGPRFIPLVVTTHYGHLYAMTENLAEYRLTPVNRHVFAFPPGLYMDEYLVFLTDRQGKPRAVDLANMILPRR